MLNVFARTFMIASRTSPPQTQTPEEPRIARWSAPHHWKAEHTDALEGRDSLGLRSLGHSATRKPKRR